MNDYFNDFFTEHADLSKCRDSIEQAFLCIKGCYLNKGKLLICGNGGSASDAEHIVGELMKGFLLERGIPRNDRDAITEKFPDEAEYLIKNLQRALPALSLVSQTAFLTAYMNDKAPDMIFAQQVYGYAEKVDALIVISTSGNAANVCNAARVARSIGVRTIGMTGEKKCLLDGLCDIVIKVPSDITYKIQELHVSVYHVLCSALENEFFGNEG